MRVGIEIAGALSTMFGDKYDVANTVEAVWQQPIRSSASSEVRIRPRWRHDGAADEARWRRLRAKYLLYR